jgi:predicted amidohydrolase
MARFLRVGIVQFEPSYSPSESLDRVKKLLEGVRVEADLIVLPEYANVYPAGVPREELAKLAEEPDDSPFIKGLSRLAVEYGAVVVSGFYEGAGEECRYSSVVAVEADGSWSIVYRKNILFDAYNIRESQLLCSGGQPPPLLSVRGVPASVFVCFELRFPEVARCAALRGAQLLLVPTAWYAGSLKEEHLRFHARSRAVENGVYLVVAALTGRHFTGRSMVVTPFGVVAVDAGHEPRYVEALLDLSEVDRARRQLPLLELAKRSFGLYMDCARSALGV